MFILLTTQQFAVWCIRQRSVSWLIYRNNPTIKYWGPFPNILHMVGLFLCMLYETTSLFQHQQINEIYSVDASAYIYNIIEYIKFK